MYSLEYVIRQHKHIAPSRKVKVIDFLNQNNITTWDQLISWIPPYNFKIPGLTKNEVRVLFDMRSKEIHVRKMFETEKAELLKVLIKASEDIPRINPSHKFYQVKGEAIRTLNILIENTLGTRALLASKSADELSALKGIGPVRKKILLKAKDILNRSKQKMGTVPSASDVHQPLFQPLTNYY